MNGTEAYVLSRSYTNKTVIGLGALKGSPCRIKETEHKDGRTKIVFEWIGTDNVTKQETTIYINDGTPIYVWEGGNTYKYGDLVIYESAFYRCIVENSDTTFDDKKYNEIGSPDGNYDIVQNKTLLPVRFTSADRKMYYSIEEQIFYLWNGTQWQPQTNVTQYATMPTAKELFKDRIVQYTGADTPTLTGGYFYKCVYDAESDTYSWQPTDAQEIKELTTEQMSNLLNKL